MHVYCKGRGKLIYTTGFVLQTSLKRVIVGKVIPYNLPRRKVAYGTVGANFSIVPFMFQLFAYAAQEHSEKYGSTFEQCAKISHKNHKHSINNPHACIRKEIPLKGITHSKMICKPITFAMSAPTADGSAAAVVCSREFMESNKMQVWINNEKYFYGVRNTYLQCLMFKVIRGGVQFMLGEG